jgi:hypothetical protein
MTGLYGLSGKGQATNQVTNYSQAQLEPWLLIFSISNFVP